MFSIERMSRRQVERDGAPRLILASASPRRRQLLESAGFSLDIAPTEIDEAHRAGETVNAYVLRIAQNKACAAAQSAEWAGQVALLAADTTVWIDQTAPLGKPDSAEEAADTLARLSGREHYVTTAFCVVSARDPSSQVVEACTTTVTMRSLDEATIHAYIATGEPFGKAGSYAIQGLASTFIRRIEGAWDNVVGLPVGEVIATLQKMELIEHYPWVINT